MAGMMRNAMDAIFGNAQVGNPNPVNTGLPQNPADVQNNQQNPQNRQTSTGAPGSAANNPLNPSDPSNQNITFDANGNQLIPGAKEQNEQSPLDEYKDIWEPRKDKDGNAIVKKNEPLVAFDETKFNTALETLDFTKTADPELMQKALGGDQASLIQLMNGVGKSSLAMTTKLTKNLVESALARQGETLRGEMSEQFRSQSVRNSLVEENPALNHPFAKPLVSALEGQLREKFPEASPQELKTHAQKAIKAWADSVSGNTGNSNNNQSSGKGKTVNGTDDVDWNAFVSNDLSAT